MSSGRYNLATGLFAIAGFMIYIVLGVVIPRLPGARARGGIAIFLAMAWAGAAALQIPREPHA